MSQQLKIYSKIFISCLLLVFLIFSLWLFWANLFSLMIPDINFVFVEVEKSRQILALIYNSVLIVLSVSSLISDGLGSNPKLDNFAAWVCISMLTIVDPLVEIIKELSIGNHISTILNEREDIVSSLFSAILIGALLLSIFVSKKMKARKN